MNASCAQYGHNCPTHLPFTGFPVELVLGLGWALIVLACIGFILSSPRRNS